MKVTASIEVELDKSETLKVLQAYLVDNGWWKHEWLIEDDDVFNIMYLHTTHTSLIQTYIRSATATDKVVYALYRGQSNAEHIHP